MRRDIPNYGKMNLPFELSVDGGVGPGWLVCFVGRRAELDVPERKSCSLLLVLALAITELTYSATRQKFISYVKQVIILMLIHLWDAQTSS